MNENSDKDRAVCIPDDRDVIAKLLQTAGSREEPPSEAYEQVLAATTLAWRDKVRRNRRRRVFAVAAAVASVAVIAGVILRQPAPVGPPVQVATSDHVIGDIAVLANGESDWRSLGGPGFSLVAGARLRTGDESGIGVLMGPGVSFRVDESSEVWFETPARIHLVAGTVYLDSKPGTGERAPVEIITAAGSARHIGTQYELRYKDGGLRLRVREGRVMLRHDGADLPADEGVQLSIEPDGPVEESTVTRHDADWAWVQALAPAPYVSDQSLTGLLEWVERESGRDVHFARPELRDKAARTILHGNRGRLLPMEALAVMLQTTDFQYTVASDSEILIEERRY